MKILLIDDNKSLVQIYQRILTTMDRQTDIETDSSKAFGVIKGTGPDMVLLDLLMEPVSGWEILDQIRNDPEISDIPVIILTGKVMTTEEAVRYGRKIDGFVMKPLERSLLISAVDEVWAIMGECEERYKRAVEAGLPEEKAISCRKMARRRKMLAYLKELLVRQDKLVQLRPDERSNLIGAIEELRSVINAEFNKIAQDELTCP